MTVDATVQHLLERAARDGHTALPLGAVQAALRGAELPKSIDGVVVDPPLLALAQLAAAEESVATSVRRLLAAAKPLCSTEECARFVDNLDDGQAEAVRTVAACGVSVLSGGLGTGIARTVTAAESVAAAYDGDLVVVGDASSMDVEAAAAVFEVSGRGACAPRR